MAPAHRRDLPDPTTRIDLRGTWPEERQQILILHANSLNLTAPVVAWALFDGAQPKDEQMKTGDADEPPYGSVVDAMRDGWRVMQLPQPPSEIDPGYLDHEFVLERMVPAP